MENRQRFICERVSQNRYLLPGGKNWTHEIEVKCARPVQDGVQTVKSHGIQNGYYFAYGKRIVGVLLRRTQILFHRNLLHEPIAQIENFFSHRVPLVWVALRKSTLLWLEQGAFIQQFSLCELRRLLKVSVKENEVPTEKNASRASIFATKASYISN